MKINIPLARIAFIKNLWEKGSMDGTGEQAWSSTFILDQAIMDDPKYGGRKGLYAETVAKIEAAEAEVAKEKWGGKAEQMLKAIRAADKGCIHDGDSKAQYDGFEGNQFVPARSKVKPLVINRNPKERVAEGDGVIYAGCIVNGQIEVWAQDNAYGKRINAQLMGVQFVRDAEAFSGAGRPASEDDFEDLGDLGETDTSAFV